MGVRRHHLPHTHLLHRCSWDPLRLRLHPGLQVPANCRLRVGNESRHWQPGKVLMFHVACEHETWNDSDQRRVVLIVDLWHQI
jgi:aspartyl/asparaginyl beta-hydroxylase (cupin superfamily)